MMSVYCVTSGWLSRGSTNGRRLLRRGGSAKVRCRQVFLLWGLYSRIRGHLPVRDGERCLRRNCRSIFEVWHDVFSYRFLRELVAAHPVRFRLSRVAYFGRGAALLAGWGLVDGGRVG